MAHDVLSVPISIVTSESTLSVGGQVINQFRSALKPEIVEALVCSRDWLHGDKELAQTKLDELVEDIMYMDINMDSKNDVPSTDCSNSVNIDISRSVSHGK